MVPKIFLPYIERWNIEHSKNPFHSSWHLLYLGNIESLSLTHTPIHLSLIYSYISLLHYIYRTYTLTRGIVRECVFAYFFTVNWPTKPLPTKVYLPTYCSHWRLFLQPAWPINFSRLLSRFRDLVGSLLVKCALKIVKIESSSRPTTIGKAGKGTIVLIS